MEPLDDAKFSGTKEVAEHLIIEASKLQPWIDEFVSGTGKIKAIEQFKGGQSNPTYLIEDKTKIIDIPKITNDKCLKKNA